MKRALLVVLLAACGGSADPPPAVNVMLQFDMKSCAEFCDSVDACPLQCNSEVGLFLTDGTTGEAFDQQCVPIIGGMSQTLRNLEEYIQSTFFSVEPGRSLGVEIVVYPGTLGCPRPELVGDQWIGPTGVPPLYAGRSTVYTIDDSLTDLIVPVECVSPLEECETVQTTFTTTLFNLFTLQEDDSLVANTVDVRTAFRVPAGMLPPAPEEYVLTPDVELEHMGGFAWGADGSFTQADECYGTLVTRIGVGFVPNVGSCYGQTDLVTSDIGAFSYHLDKVHVDGILDALGLATLPDEGLVIGRIAQGLLTPDETKTIRAVEPGTTMTVTYLSTDGLGNFTVVPNGSWFVISEMSVSGGAGACCDYLEIVDDQGAGTGFTTLFGVGLIRGIVMALVISS